MVIMLHWLNMVEPSSFGMWFIHVYSQSFLHFYHPTGSCWNGWWLKNTPQDFGPCPVLYLTSLRVWPGCWRGCAVWDDLRICLAMFGRGHLGDMLFKGKLQGWLFDVCFFVGALVIFVYFCGHWLGIGSPRRPTTIWRFGSSSGVQSLGLHLSVARTWRVPFPGRWESSWGLGWLN
jgi:hypothetical protein